MQFPVFSTGRHPVKNLVRFAHNWNDGKMEYWNSGSLLHCIEKYHDSCDKQIMDRKAGLNLDAKRWIETDPRFLVHHGALKKRWKYQVCTRMKKAHCEGQWRFPKSNHFLKQYPLFASMINKSQPMVFVGSIFGNWEILQDLFNRAGRDSTIAAALLRPGKQ